jgi:hypothetical protein
MSDGRAAVIMVLIASVVLCPPTRGSQRLSGSAPRNHGEAFTAHEPELSISCVLTRRPRLAASTASFAGTVQPLMVLLDANPFLVEDPHLRHSLTITPPLRC